VGPTLPSGYWPLKQRFEERPNRNGSDILTFDPFPDRESAEAWMGDSWAELLENGVEEVALEEEGSEAYRMGLRPSS
jgi:hypothetical protein